MTNSVLSPDMSWESGRARIAAARHSPCPSSRVGERPPKTPLRQFDRLPHARPGRHGRRQIRRHRVAGSTMSIGPRTGRAARCSTAPGEAPRIPLSDRVTKIGLLYFAAREPLPLRPPSTGSAVYRVKTPAPSLHLKAYPGTVPQPAPRVGNHGDRRMGVGDSLDDGQHLTGHNARFRLLHLCKDDDGTRIPETPAGQLDQPRLKSAEVGVQFFVSRRLSSRGGCPARSHERLAVGEGAALRRR